MLNSFIFANIAVFVVFGVIEFFLYKKGTSKAAKVVFMFEGVSIAYAFVSLFLLSIEYMFPQAYWYGFWGIGFVAIVAKFLFASSWALDLVDEKDEKANA